MTKLSTKIIFLEFLKLGLYSFGGPTAHIGYFKQKFVLKDKWLTENQFMEIVSICQFLPGPTSSQIGYTIGLLKGGGKGGLAAWLGFTLPSAFIMILGALCLTQLSTLVSKEILFGLLQGFASVAIPVVAVALLTMQKMFCFSSQRILIALFTTALLFLIEFPMEQIFVISLAFILGIFLKLGSEDVKKIGYLHNDKGKIFLLALLVFLLSFVTLVILPMSIPSGQNHTWNFLKSFYQSGALVFGGGHVVLPLLEKEFVQSGFISQSIFIGGYGLAQGLPGPLFSFGAYLGTILGVSSGNYLMGIFFGLICLVVIFMPGLVLIPIVLNYWQSIQTVTWVRNGLGGVNASVVGLLLYTFITPMLANYLTNPKGILLVLMSSMLMIYLKFPAWIIVLLMGPVGLFLYTV